MDFASNERPSSGTPARYIVQSLRRRIDLIIMLALRECEQLRHIGRDPRRRGRQVHPASFQSGALNFKPALFVADRSV